MIIQNYSCNIYNLLHSNRLITGTELDLQDSVLTEAKLKQIIDPHLESI